eukprot:g48319.t1
MIMNPLKSTYNTDYAERLCCRTSCTVLNHLIHQLYSRCRNPELEIESTFSACAQDTAEQLRDTAKQTRQHNYTIYMYTKNKKLEKLGITTSTYQVSPDTTVESGTTTRKSIVNLSDHTLQLDKIEALSQGLNSCPTTKMDPIGHAADTEEFHRQMRFWEFFYKPQDVSSEPNETTKELEQSKERSVVQRPKKKESNWTSPEGCCPRLDMYAQAVRRCVLTSDSPAMLTRLTMDYSSELASFFDTRISIKDGYLNTSLYRKPTDNLTVLHFSSFHPKYIKKVIPYGQALRIHRICSDEEKRDGHLKVLKDALIRTGNVPSQLGNTSAVKGIQPLIFGQRKQIEHAHNRCSSAESLIRNNICRDDEDYGQWSIDKLPYANSQEQDKSFSFTGSSGSLMPFRERNYHSTLDVTPDLQQWYDAQLINRQFQQATAKNHNDLLKRQTWDSTDR